MNLAHEPVSKYPAYVLRYQNRERFYKLSSELRSQFTLLRQMDVADKGLFAPLADVLGCAHVKHVSNGDLRGVKLGRPSYAHF